MTDQRPHVFFRHGIIIEDPWHWLRDGNFRIVVGADGLAYLAAVRERVERLGVKLL